MWVFFLFCFVFGGRGISNELGGLPVVYLHGNAHDFLKKWMAPKQTTTTFQKPAGRVTFYKDSTKYERSTSLKESWHFKTFKKKKKQNKYEKVSCPTIVSKEPISSAQLRFVTVMSMLQEVYLLSFKVKMKVSVT